MGQGVVGDRELWVEQGAGVGQGAGGMGQGVVGGVGSAPGAQTSEV